MTATQHSQDQIMPQPRVVGVNGSPRKHGNSETLLRHLLKSVETYDLATEAVDLRDYSFSSCIGCEQCRQDKACTGLQDDMQRIYPKIQQSQGLVLVSPTHHYNVTAWMKAFIDRLYCFYNFTDPRPGPWSSRLAGQGRKVVLLAICEQADPHDMGWTLEAMRLPAAALGYEVVGELPVLRAFDRGIVREDAATLQQTAELGATLAKALKEA
jgi:multimeric flavodoxin WrbA